MISGPEAAIIELVKNAYDADATRVNIKFVPPLKIGKGLISVSDDGHGMDLTVISEKWMEPATTSKIDNRKSPGGRTMMGSKGIGRFAAAKLGKKMSLNSSVVKEDGTLEVLIPEIDWDEFSGDRYLSDIEIDYIQQQTSSPSGTLIEIRELSETWTSIRLTRLLLELRRLVSPVSNDSLKSGQFRIFLDLSECTVETTGFDGLDIMKTAFGEAPGRESIDFDPFEVKPYPMLTSSDYELRGKFNAKGNFSGIYENRRGNQGPEEVELDIPEDDENGMPGPFSVHFYLFDRESEPLKANMSRAGLGDLSVKEARKILDEVAGVAVYKEGFRVRPYGDVESDWLTLDRRRVQNPSLRIGNNQVAGYVSISSTDNSDLAERSSREGFEENAAFRRLRNLIIELFARVIEPKRLKFREGTGLSRKQTGSFDQARKEAGLRHIREKIIPLVPPEQRDAAESVLSKESIELSKQIDELEERQRVLEAGSSLGAIVGEILHEGAPLSTYIEETAPRIHAGVGHLLKDLDGSKQKGDMLRKLELVEDSATTLSELFRSLRPLAGGKRGTPISFNPAVLLGNTIALFENHEIEFMIENSSKVHAVIGYEEDLATALVNIISNSIHWLEQHNIPSPEVKVSFFRNEEGVGLFIDDNGPGIPDEFLEHIFDVGFSLKSDGTGLGLNIARETLARSGARLRYHPEYNKGTRFEIFYPREVSGK